MSELGSAVSAAVATDVAELSNDELRELLVAYPAFRTSLQAAWAKAVREAERRQLHQIDGHRSIGSWLRAYTLCSGRDGSSAGWFARRLSRLPLTLAALEAAEISESDAKQICYLLKDVPFATVLESEQDLITAEKFQTALNAVSTPDPGSVPEDERRTPTQRRHDALDEVLTRILDLGELPEVRREKPHVGVNADLKDLTDGTGTAELEWTGPVDISIAQMLLCDAKVHPIIWRSQDGETSNDNCVLLCRYHHRLLHKPATPWTATGTAEATLVFTSPDGHCRLESSAPGPPRCP